jgi:hypothetical protein
VGARDTSVRSTGERPIGARVILDTIVRLS